MGGMPLLDSTKWLHEVNWLYFSIVPAYIWINNFLGPRVMEPVFCRDFLVAQFDKIASAESSTAAASASKDAAASSGKKFMPTPGKAPKLPQNMFARSFIRRGGPGGALTLGFAGLLSLSQQQQPSNEYGA